MVPRFDMCRSIISLSRITHGVRPPIYPQNQGNKKDSGHGGWGLSRTKFEKGG